MRDLASENWSYLAAAFERAGVTPGPEAEIVDVVVSRYLSEFDLRASALLDSTDLALVRADIETTADWLVRRFATEMNEVRQRRLGVTHYIWGSQDDAKVRTAHAERDDRLLSWDDRFSDGHPGHGYNCRCFAEPAILEGAILLTDVTVSAGLSDRIARAQGDGLADAAAEAAAGGVQSIYSALRFSWLGYRRLFGAISPEEEAERLAMRENLIRAIDTIVNLDAETVRRMAEAFVEYFDARHADLCLLDLEHRLGLVSEDALLRAYRDTPEYRAARDTALYVVTGGGGYLEVALPIEDVLGRDLPFSVEGVVRLGSRSAPRGVAPVNFEGGPVVARFRIAVDVEPRLITMFPVGRVQ